MHLRQYELLWLDELSPDTFCELAEAEDDGSSKSCWSEEYDSHPWPADLLLYWAPDHPHKPTHSVTQENHAVEDQKNPSRRIHLKVAALFQGSWLHTINGT